MKLFGFTRAMRSLARPYSTNSPPILIKKDEVFDFISRCMRSVGVERDHADQLSNTLVAADYRGHFSHGLNRLEMYINDIQQDVCKCVGEPEVTNQSASCARVDGSNLLGPVVGNYAMKLAIKKAKETGVGMVTAARSNHYGIAGWYSLQAVDEGLIGMSMCNTSPLCVPTRGKQLMTGTNAFSYAAPGVDGDCFVLDMATTTVAIGKVELAMRRGEKIPSSWGVDGEGQPCTDPETVFNKGGLMPIGGSEETGGYKGYGLNVMVEAFCGLLANANYGPNIRKWASTEGEANLGQFFAAIDPSAFGAGFSERLQSLMTLLILSQPSKENSAVLVAGDPERQHMSLVDSNDGKIPYHENQVVWADGVAQGLGVRPMKR